MNLFDAAKHLMTTFITTDPERSEDTMGRRRKHKKMGHDKDIFLADDFDYGGYGSSGYPGHTISYPKTNGSKVGDGKSTAANTYVPPVATGAKKWCEHPPKLYLEISPGTDKALNVYCAKDSGTSKGLPAKAPPGKILWLDCTDSTYQATAAVATAIRSAPKAWLDFFPQYTAPTPDIIALKWPDQGIPPLVPEFWKQFLLKVQAMGYRHLVVFCMGGHGRTGTALACIELVCYPHQTVKETIKNVKEYHCSQAIESWKQEDYIADVAAWAAEHWLDDKPEELTAPVLEPEADKKQTKQAKKSSAEPKAIG